MHDERNGFRPNPLQLAVGVLMGLALAVVLGLALGSWTYAFIGFAAGFLIYSPIAFRSR